MIYDGETRQVAARHADVTLQTIRDWVLWFNAEGPQGLLDGKSPGTPPKLDASQKAALVRVGDLLYAGGKAQRFTSPRIDSKNTHGTGCTLASSIAAGIAQGLPLAQAVARARAYVWQAIASAPGFGHGHGPLNHAHTVGEFTGVE